MQKSQLPKRKNIRLKDYSYKTNGYYFITLCNDKNKKLISKYKIFIQQTLLDIPNRFTGVYIDTYVLMSDHIHLIIILDNCQKNLGEIIRSFKAIITKNTESNFWQRNYFEHIIRNDKALDGIREYIVNNPLAEELKFEDFYK